MAKLFHFRFFLTAVRLIPDSVFIVPKSCFGVSNIFMVVLSYEHEQLPLSLRMGGCVP
jgi:hypothetical protein